MPLAVVHACAKHTCEQRAAVLASPSLLITSTCDAAPPSDAAFRCPLRVLADTRAGAKALPSLADIAAKLGRNLTTLEELNPGMAAAAAAAHCCPCFEMPAACSLGFALMHGAGASACQLPSQQKWPWWKRHFCCRRNCGPPGPHPSWHYH